MNNGCFFFCTLFFSSSLRRCTAFCSQTEQSRGLNLSFFSHMNSELMWRKLALSHSQLCAGKSQLMSCNPFDPFERYCTAPLQRILFSNYVSTLMIDISMYTLSLNSSRSSSCSGSAQLNSDLFLTWNLHHVWWFLFFLGHCLTGSMNLTSGHPLWSKLLTR